MVVIGMPLLLMLLFSILVFDRLKSICESISIGEIWINSSGDGITLDRLTTLKSLGVKGIMFSLHSHVPENINAFMKRDYAWENLKNGISELFEICNCSCDVILTPYVL